MYDQNLNLIIIKYCLFYFRMQEFLQEECQAESNVFVSRD